MFITLSAPVVNQSVEKVGGKFVGGIGFLSIGPALIKNKLNFTSFGLVSGTFQNFGDGGIRQIQNVSDTFNNVVVSHNRGLFGLPVRYAYLSGNENTAGGPKKKSGFLL